MEVEVPFCLGVDEMGKEEIRGTRSILTSEEVGERPIR